MIPLSKPFIGDEEKAAVMAVLDSGMLAQGPRVAELEERFAQLTGTRYAVATSSGTAALHLALLAHGIGPGDEVITSAFTFIASANCILYAGAKPVFADVDEPTFNLDPERVAEAVTTRTRAILPVHLYGQPCDMDALCEIAKQHELAIVEDAAQAVGAAYHGRPVGSFGTAAFSLYATKNVMSAEGGIVTTDDEAVADSVRLLRNHGMRRRYYHEQLGYNLRMTDIQAALGLAQLDRLEGFTAARQANARWLNERVQSAIPPQALPDRTHVWHQYTVRFPGGTRDKAARQLAEAGVGSGIFYPIPAHQQEYVRARVGDCRLPVTERLATEVLSLPVHPLLTPDDLETIVRAVNGLRLTAV